MKKKIVLTCGPASENDAILQLMSRIADGFRLNVAHLDAASLERWLKKLVALREKCQRQFQIILDLQGAKVRIGRYPAVETVPERVRLVAAEISDDPAVIPVPSASVFAGTSAGDRLLLNDRRVIVRVTAKKSDCLLAEVEQNGPLASGKGLNSPDRVFEMARVTANDRAAILLSREIEQIAYAVSFVADGSEAGLFRPMTGAAPLIAKIEQREAFRHLDVINREFAELWLCRGDLGAEAGLKQLGTLQRQFVAAMGNCEAKPALLAGEVLGSMVRMPIPGRAEVVQLDDAMHCGFAGIVLSDETACGSQVPAVVNFLADFMDIR
jgi:pyruvate kinase